MARDKMGNRAFSRRSLLKTMGFAPLILRPSPFFGSSLLFDTSQLPTGNHAFPFADTRLAPHYPARSPLADVLLLVEPGSDEYVTEKYASDLEAILSQWSRWLRTSLHDLAGIATSLDNAIQATSLLPEKEVTLRSSNGVACRKGFFAAKTVPGKDHFMEQVSSWLHQISQVEVAEFAIVSIEEISLSPLALRVQIRYELVARRKDEQREERVGTWATVWQRDEAAAWKAHRWEALQESVSVAAGPGFIDVTKQVLGRVDSYTAQMLRGSDYWRTVLDGACGIDVYGNNGVAAGDFDNDGLDDLYVCQPSGLPNRLYRNRGDGTFEDVTGKAGVGVLDNSACALFADFANSGRQDLLVVCGSGPLLFKNQGDGTFLLQPKAFRFETPAQGTFTHAAVADYDGDGHLDIYFCLYSYYLGLDQYHYPAPYFDARNGPANFLFRNDGQGSFIDQTRAAGLSAENDRYSFACAWGHATATGLPDLYVSNDFGRSNLYRNNGDGTFKAVSSEAHVADAGAGMSAAWCDCNNDGNQSIYAANMWSAAGLRISAQKQFQEKASAEARSAYQRHARGNSFYQNQGGGRFANLSQQAGVEMGRWSWCSDFWDFDHDGYADLYVANGYVSAPDPTDLSSFFWRQVVGKSPADATPSLAYEHGWNALNELIRSDRTWSGFERNVLFANNHDGTFSRVGAALGLDCIDDSRSFALADLDGDGRLEVIVKNRNAPQLRILHNAMTQLGSGIVFRLRGHISNRDAIGAAVTVTAGRLQQTRYLQAGSGFLSQHSKELFFGLGEAQGVVRASVRWPNGLVQTFDNLPVNHRIALEEGVATFSARPFAAGSPWTMTTSAAGIEPLPTQIDTWLIDPLKAPTFALPDLSGNIHALQALQGKFVLLFFWTVTAPGCAAQWKLLQHQAQSRGTLAFERVAINVDDPEDLPQAKAFSAQQKVEFAMLFATQEVAGVYNLIYRYLFDRRRDLALPCSFLLDPQGMIVKLYQGTVEPARVMDDVSKAPATPAERLHKALPFAGVRASGSFERNDFTYGVAFFQHGYLAQAAESFAQVIATKPNDAEGYYNLGTLNLRRSDFEQARYYLRETLKRKPDYPEAWNNLGMIAAQQGQVEEAIQNFQQSLLLRPGYATALENLGNVYRRQRSYTKAQDYLQQALAIQPDDAEIHYSLGMLYAQQSQTQQASEYLNSAIALRPDYAEALNNLGVLFVHGQDYDKAEEQFKTCIRVAPAFDQAYLNLARLYALRNDKEQAKTVLQKLLALQPQNAAARQALGAVQ